MTIADKTQLETYYAQLKPYLKGFNIDDSELQTILQDLNNAHKEHVEGAAGRIFKNLVRYVKVN